MLHRTYRPSKYLHKRRTPFSFLKKPAVQLLTVLLVVAIVVIIALVGGKYAGRTVREVNVDQAYQLYQGGVYVLDVSWPAEWDQYHIPNTTLIPLDQLYNRFSEVPKDRQVLIVSHSPTTSQEARDLLLSGGINAVSMNGSLSDWYAKGYPTEGTPPPP